MWGWGKRNLPTVNYVEDSSEEYKSTCDSDSDSNSQLSPPPGTPLDESPDGLGQLRETADQLNASLRIQEVADRLRSEMPPKVPYDLEDKEDGEDYYKRISNIKLQWDPDVEYWFNSIEASMRHATVHSQWTKREVLQSLLPDNVRDEVRYLLRLPEDKAGTTPYKDVKVAIIELFGPKPQDAIDKALTRVLTTRPSALGKQLIDDICKCSPQLKSQCCADIVFGLFRRQMPTAVRNALARETFNHKNYTEVFTLADKVFHSNKGEAPSVSAVRPIATGSAAAVAATPAAEAAAPVVTVSPEIAALQAEVAALKKANRGGGRGGRNNRGGGNQNWGGGNQSSGSNRGGNRGGGCGGRGGQSAQGGRGPRHPDSPPNSACQVHWQRGRGAWWCADPQNCPWKDITTPRPTQ